jgi:hypothetical protein
VSGVAVDPRQRREEVQLAGDQSATRAAGRDQRRDPTVDLGVERVAEPQLEAGAERVAHGRAEVGPPAARHQQVEAEREAAAGQLLQVQLDVVEVGAQRAPAVDDEVHVAVPVVDPALGPPGAVRLDRVDALGPEVRLARSTMPVTSATIRRTTSGSDRLPTPATCGSPAIGEKAPPPKSIT